MSGIVVAYPHWIAFVAEPLIHYLIANEIADRVAFLMFFKYFT